MSIAEKFETIADEVYTKAQEDFFVLTLQSGNRTDCEYAFRYWDVEYIRPPFVLRPTTRSINCFNQCKKLKKIEKKYFDFSSCTASGTGANGHFHTCSYCSELEVFEDIKLPAPGEYTFTWANGLVLHTIELVRSTKETIFTNTFGQCRKLENIRFEGEIGQSISFLHSPLSMESVKDIIEHLYDYSGTTTKPVLTLKDDVKAELQALTETVEYEGQTYTYYNLIAVKGWTLQ